MNTKEFTKRMFLGLALSGLLVLGTVRGNALGVEPNSKPATSRGEKVAMAAPAQKPSPSDERVCKLFRIKGLCTPDAGACKAPSQARCPSCSK